MTQQRGDARGDQPRPAWWSQVALIGAVCGIMVGPAVSLTLSDSDNG